jgi:hypothetical protein
VGRVTRRKGFEYEAGYSTSSETHISTGVVNEYNWRNVAGVGTLTMVVAQIDNVLSFFAADTVGALSAGKKSFTIDLDTYKTAGSPGTETEVASFASGDGRLFVTHPYCESFYVEYDNDADTISVTQITIKVRDFDGVDDGLAVNERPTTLSALHHYNLFNQGWWVSDVKTSSSVLSRDYPWLFESPDPDPVLPDQFFAWMGVYPANSDIWFLGRDSTGDLTQASYQRNPATGSPAAQGHYVLTAVNKDRSGVSGVAGLTVTSSGYFRPSATAFFAGRAFYSGVRGQDYNGVVYYSQIIKDTGDYGLCHTRLDPTDEHYFDTLDTDGGEIRIQGCGNILFMFPMDKYLIVFADNGIWYISGSDGSYFSATNQAINRLSSTSALSELSVVDVEGSPMFWNDEGIYIIIFDPKAQGLVLRNLTESTIYTDFYEDIPVENKYYAKGTYNPRTKIVQWCYRSVSASTNRELFEYDRILNFDLVSSSFYGWDNSYLADAGPQVNGILTTIGVGSSIVEEEIFKDDLTTQVFKDDGTTPVTASVVTTVPYDSTTKFLTLVNTATDTYNLTFSETSRTDYVDWLLFDSAGIDYDSYSLTGPLVLGKGMIDGEANWVQVFMEEESDASLYLKARWEWSNTADSGRWTQQQECYPARSGYGLQRKRLKVRGQGEAVQLYFYSQSGKPFTLVGWAGAISIDPGP